MPGKAIDVENLYPVPVEVEAGRSYAWCGCGKSKTQPLCDNTEGCEQMVSYHSPLTETVYFCACKQTRNPPFCDGSHGKVMMELLQQRQQGLTDENGRLENG